MTASTQHRVLARWTGFCASCPEESPLLLVATGPHGLRGWLSGGGSEDRTLSYSCAVCGRVEHVPATEEEDAVYDASLVRWPDWESEAEEPELVAPATVQEPVQVPVHAFVPEIVRSEHVAPEVEASDLIASEVLLPELFLLEAEASEEPTPAVVSLPAAPRRPGTVTIVSLPAQRGSATDVLVAAA